MYVRELKVRYRCRRINARCQIPEGRVSTPRAAANLLVPLLGSEVVEVCGLLCLTVRRDVVAYHELFRGTIDASIVQPRDVFRTVLLAHAPAVIVAHNHPSGDATPSPDDFALTRRLKESGSILGIELADHIVVTTAGQYFSFHESGVL